MDKQKLNIKKTLVLRQEPRVNRKVFTLRCDKDFKENLKYMARSENKTLNQFIISKLIKSYSVIVPFSSS